MTYAEKLKDPRWQRKRLEIMDRDQFKCTYCGDSESTLNVHHHYYTKGANPWDYPCDALTTLCEHCHGMVEEMRMEILKSLTWEVPMDAVHRLATSVDPFFLSEIALAFTGNNDARARISRISMAKRAIERIETLIAELEAEGGLSAP